MLRFGPSAFVFAPFDGASTAETGSLPAVSGPALSSFHINSGEIDNATQTDTTAHPPHLRYRTGDPVDR
ncbi:hypothetical protein GCM10022212_00170 [Actimicrobium antarcticum]|uniref:Uncharacterized protein n=1 Tax=Actimicrobium antarcticum TaxID=1051899 RepID=A0ABP7SFV6_9BURK